MIECFDELTGLAVKELFYLNVEKAIALASSNEHCIIYLDIDNFKMINDFFGHQKGDEILKAIASQVLSITKNKTLCSRVNSDWFAFYMESEDFSEEKLNQISEEINNQFQNETMLVAIHFGVYKFSKVTDSISAVAGCAKRVLKTIKGNSIKTIAYYDQAFMEHEKREQYITKTFDSALKKGEFKIFLQPQVSSDNELKGAEVLVRWINDKNEIKVPDHFIGTLEKTGLISKLDHNIWEQAASLLKEWKGTDKDHLYLSINISVKDFNNINVYAILNDIVKKYEIPPQKLRLEITESVLMTNTAKILEITNKLRRDGFFIEVDDFGKGYSSLSMLKDIDVDMIKIDMDFLHHTRNEEKSAIILESIISMSKKLGIEVLTEGVETKEQKDFLNSVGCHMFQGYYYDKPMPVSKFYKKYFDVC